MRLWYQVTRLCDLSVDGDSVTSVCWNERVMLPTSCTVSNNSRLKRAVESLTVRLFWFEQGSLVAVGTHKGYVQIWDAAGGRKLTCLEGHSARVGQYVSLLLYRAETFDLLSFQAENGKAELLK